MFGETPPSLEGDSPESEIERARMLEELGSRVSVSEKYVMNEARKSALSVFSHHAGEIVRTRDALRKAGVPIPEDLAAKSMEVETKLRELRAQVEALFPQE